MEKISISVRIPALDNTYEFIVPRNMSIKDAQNLMIKILNLEYGISNANTDVILVNLSDNLTLRLECNFVQLGISDGAKLLMI